MEKFAAHWKFPMYQLFYDGDERPKLPILPEAEVVR